MSAIVYVVTIDDRHSGPYTYLYAGKDAALARAREATALAEAHYHVKADEIIGVPNDARIYFSCIEDGCEVTVEESKLLDVEDADNPYLLHGDELKRTEDARRAGR